MDSELIEDCIIYAIVVTPSPIIWSSAKKKSFHCESSG